jgi:adenine-specific DNA-methyltransferase
MDWANRLMLGDSLLVMNSLLERELMTGKVQMIYVDPPYGVRFASNFQPRIDRRDVKDDDASLTREPEMIKAYRDTWTLGIHSYLMYLRDRLLLARQLLAPSGSAFIQISDENLHHVRELMDEVFGRQNFVCLITFSKTTGFSGRTLASIADYILWYARDQERLKYRQLFRPKRPGDEGATKYRPLREIASVPQGRFDPEKLAAIDQLTSQGATRSEQTFEFEQKVWRPPAGMHWKTTVEGLKRLATAGRIVVEGDSLRYVRFLDDFPVFPIANVWEDVGGIQERTEGKLYVVQTATLAIERCLLMTTDPGNLILDPTCGSGTTAYVAEQWGRRWITCDTSRVALAIARQRLLTATFPYYKLAYPDKGVAGGFVYKTVPHITLRSVAKN